MPSRPAVMSLLATSSMPSLSSTAASPSPPRRHGSLANTSTVDNNDDDDDSGHLVRADDDHHQHHHVHHHREHSMSDSEVRPHEDICSKVSVAVATRMLEEANADEEDVFAENTLRSSLSSEAEFYSLDDEEDRGSNTADAGSDSDSSSAAAYSPSPRTPPTVYSLAQDDFRHIPLLERLIRTHPIWYLPNIGRAGATHLLHNKSEGMFLVSQGSQLLALSVRVGAKPAIQHYVIQSTPHGLRLQGACHYYTAIPVLIAYYCQHRSDLPTNLVLPDPILQAKTHQELTSLGLLGQAFWTSSVTRRKKKHSQTAAQTHNISPYHMGAARKSLVSNGDLSRSAHALTGATCKLTTFKPLDTSTMVPKSHIGNGDAICNGLEDYDEDEDGLFSLSNHSETSAFQKPNVKVPEADMISERSGYDNVPGGSGFGRPPRPYFRPIQNGSVSEDTDTEVLIRENFARAQPHRGKPGNSFNPDWNLSGKHGVGFVGPRLFPDASNKETEHVETFQTTRLERIVPSGLSKKDEPVVFTFDVVMPTSDADVQKRSPGEIFCTRVTRPIADARRQSDSQHSSPAYAEPYDSLLVNNRHPSKSMDSIHLLNQDNRYNCGVAGGKPPRVIMRKVRQTNVSKHHLLGQQKKPMYRERVVIKPVNLPQVSATPCEEADIADYQSPFDSKRKFFSPMSRSQSLKQLTSHMTRPTRARSLPKVVTDHQQVEPSAVPLQTVAESRVETTPPNHVDYVERDNSRQCRSETPPAIKKFVEEEFLQPEIIRSLQGANTPRLHKFPVYGSNTSLCSDRTSFSDTSTAEDLLSYHSPELTLRPIKPLTRQNLQRMSDYDNLQSHGPTSHRTTASSMGTQYCQPWDSSPWHKILAHDDGTTTPKFPVFMSSPPPPSLPLPHRRSTPDVWKDARENLDDRASSDADFNSLYVESEAGKAPSEALGSEVPVSSFVYESLSRERTAATRHHTPPARPCSSRLGDDLDLDIPTVLGEDQNISDEEGAEGDLRGPNLANKFMPLLTTPKLIGQYSRGSNCPGVKVRDYVAGLAAERHTTFGVTVANFIQCTKEGTETNPHIVVRNVRQFMNGIKNYLVQHGEAKLEEIIERERSKLQSDSFLNIDSVIERALHKCVIWPLKQHIYTLFIDEYKRNGDLGQMSDCIKFARTKTPYELGIKPGILPPQGTNLEVVKHFLTKMQRAYSPLKKLENLVGAVNSIRNNVQGSLEASSDNLNNGQLVVATDDFLPVFIYALSECGMVTAEIEAEYMWGLLHPCLLAGEGGYHLSTYSGAVHILKTLRAMMESATQCPHLSVLGEEEGFMKIIIPDERRDSIVTKTLPLRPSMTTKDVCNMIAHKFCVTNPQDHGLYIINGPSEERLSELSFPQVARDQLHTHGHHCTFAYKRNNAKFVWPVSLRT